MEKQHNNDQSAADADCGADTLTDNSYVSSSGSDSDESNTSLLEKNSILSDKFMLPKDLCENATIFHEFFSSSLWDSLPQTCRQHLIKFLPISPEDRPLEVTKLVHDLFAHKLHRFGTDQMAVFQHNLAEGNFRSDIVKLRCSLGKSLRKERKMLELQRMARLAQNVVLSREATLLAELQSNGGSFMPPAFPPRFAPSGYRNRWARQLHGTKQMEKCRINAKKRYLREICSVSELTGIPLSISDEEDCLDAIPSGPVRKQRRMFGAGPHVSSDNSQSLHRQGSVHGNNATFGGGHKRATHPSGTSGIGTNVFDGTNFVTPKLFVVTDEHYQKLLLQYRKRKIEEPNHPELVLDGVKLKDVVSRTQLAAGYRRILPLPKVYMPEVLVDGTVEDTEKVRSLKSIKASRMSSDQEDMKYTPSTAMMKTGSSVVAKVEPFENDGKLIPKVEQISSSMFDISNVQTDVKPPTAALCKQEDIETLLPTVTPDQQPAGACFADQSDEKIVASTNKHTPSMVKASGELEGGSGPVMVDILIGNDTHACFLSLVRDLFCSNPDHRSTMGELQLKLDAWAKGTTAARNSWYDEYQNNGEWNVTLQSAVQFLTGDFQHQPEDFVPYIEHKVALNILQWIGASRDGDCRLVPLCAFWHSRKMEMELTFTGRHPKTPSIATNVHGAVVTPTTGNTTGGATGSTALVSSAKGKNKNSITNTKLLLLSSNSSSSSSSSLSSISSMTTIGDGSPMLAEVPTPGSMSLGALCSSHVDDDGSVSERSVSPPPPRFPTDWAVRKATDEEVRSFREQEKLRYENPHMAFTYKQHSYDSVVGPVKGIYTQVPGISKARGHSMLVADRPNFVTILTLVRDATARLPNGEGTRADICELLKSSQYISPTATDQILQTIVSGALDRMHTEHDPCVKYDAKRKIWIYLHRNRTEEEFERLHLQYQGFTKHKKTVVRKSTKCHKENASPTSKIASVESAPTDSLSSVDMAHEQADLSSGATSHLESSSATGGNAVAIKTPVVSTPVASPSIKPATSLLKKQPLSVLSNATPDEIYSGAGTLTKKVVQPDQSRNQTVQQQPLLASTESPTEPTMNIAPKSGSVTIITSTGSSVKTIKIPKSSLSLTTKPANVYGPTSSTNTVSGAQMENSSPVENAVPSYLTLPQKNVLVSAFVSTAKPAPETASIVSTVGLRKVPSMPIVVQSSPASTHLQSSSTLVSSATEVEKRVQPGSSVLSIRQLNNNNTGIVVASGPASTPGAGVPDQSSPVVSSQMLLQTKALQFPLSNATIVSSTGGNPGVKVSTTMVGVVAPSPKPIFTTSTGSSHIKTLPASGASILSQNTPSAVVSTALTTANLAPQRVVVSNSNVYTPANSIAGSPSITLKSSALVPTVSGSQSTATIIPTNATHRVIRPATNLISTITLAKGQQSMLTPAQQKQILQNLLSQQQKQQILTAKKIGPAQVVASSAAPVSGESKPGETTNQPAATVSLLQENQRLAGAVSTFKLQHHPNANQTIRALSPQIVRITPTRVSGGPASGSGLASNSGSANSTTTIAVSSPMAPMSAGMKMMKVHPSGILTSTGTHTMLPAGTVATGNVVAVPAAAAGSTATMRVLKTATGTTTVIKTAGVHGTAPATTQLSPQTRSIHQAKLRKDGSSPIVSKVTVTPNVSTAGQLIPLESLLQKQGITTTTGTNLPGGVVGSTFLKIASTGKAGQPQFLQFSTNTTNVATGTQVTASVSPVTSVSGGGHQYAVLAQNARNIISVTPSTAGTTNRPANMPITIVSSMAQDVNDVLKSPASTHVSGSGTLASIGAVSTVSAGTCATVLPHATGTGKLPQANKIKLFASNIATASSGQQQGTIIGPKTSMTSTVLSGSGGEFLNAKIIGVRNVAAAKMKAGSSLSIMNAANLNIAHIGGKPIIIANSSSLSASSTNTATGIVTNSNSSTGTGSTMVLTSNANYSNVLQIDPSAKGKNVINASSVSSGEGDGTAGASGSGTIVNSQTGHMQTQTLMLGNQLVKVQTIQAATAGKLAHQKRHTILSDGSAAQRETISAPSTILTTAGGCTVVPQQPQAAPLSVSGNAATGASAPKSISVTSTVATGVMPKSIVKIQPGSSTPSNTTAKIIEMGQTKPTAPNSQRVVLATSSGHLLTQPIILPSGFQSSGPINIKRLKVIPVSKQCKK